MTKYQLRVLKERTFSTRRPTTMRRSMSAASPGTIPPWASCGRPMSNRYSSRKMGGCAASRRHGVSMRLIVREANGSGRLGGLGRSLVALEDEVALDRRQCDLSRTDQLPKLIPVRSPTSSSAPLPIRPSTTRSARKFSRRS
jgi:hypothetical protein